MEIVPNMILTFHPSLLDKNGEECCTQILMCPLRVELAA